jgi:hypothetical protein
MNWTRENSLEAIDAELKRITGKPRRERQIAEYTEARAKIEAMTADEFRRGCYGAASLGADESAVVSDVLEGPRRAV